MRFLKKKINLQKELLDDEETQVAQKSEVQIQRNTLLNSTPTICSAPEPQRNEIPLAIRKPHIKPIDPDKDSKNIVKNYGKAFCSFASSQLAIPYIEAITRKNDISIQIPEFFEFIRVKKEEINNIESLRKLLLADRKDTNPVVTYKKIFKELSVIFIKYFSVNWIFSGRLRHKISHLKARFKMLRRIQNPEYFTYMKIPTKSKSF